MVDVVLVKPPFDLFSDADGSPLNAGYIYVGTENLEPVTNPIALFWDEALTIPAAQPLRTLNGYVARAGSPAKVYAGTSDYSILVQDKKGRLVFSDPSAEGSPLNLQNIRADLANTADPAKGDAMVGVKYPTTGTARTQHDKNQEHVSPEDFGAVGDGVTDDAPAFAKANATGRTIWLAPKKNYVINTPTTIDVDLRGEGAFTNKSIITLTGTGQLIVGAWHLTWEGFWLKSSVAGKTFVKCTKSYFTMRNFRFGGNSHGGTHPGTDPYVSANQVGIEFDFSVDSIYFADITLYKIQDVAYPFKFTGPSVGVQSFSASRVGSSRRDDLQTFTTAFSFVGSTGVSVIIDNHIHGYLENNTAVESGRVATSVAGITKFRDNQIDLLLDGCPTLIYNDQNIEAPNWWTVRTDNIIKTGAGLLTQQVWLNNKARFRVYRADPLSISDAAYGRIGFDTVVFDEGGNIDGNGLPTGCYNTTNAPITNAPFADKAAYCFTAVNTMKLSVYGQLEVTTNIADQAEVKLAVYKNAAPTAESVIRASGSAGVRVSVSDIVDLAPGDTVSIWVYADTTGGNADVTLGATNTYFMGQEL